MTTYLNHGRAGVNQATMELRRPGSGQFVLACQVPIGWIWEITGLFEFKLNTLKLPTVLGSLL